MVQTSAGGRKTAQTIKEKWGTDFYREIGRKGGKNGHTGGFASNVVGRDGLLKESEKRFSGEVYDELNKILDEQIGEAFTKERAEQEQLTNKFISKIKEDYGKRCY